VHRSVLPVATYQKIQSHRYARCSVFSAFQRLAQIQTIPESPEKSAKPDAFAPNTDERGTEMQNDTLVDAGLDQTLNKTQTLQSPSVSLLASIKFDRTSSSAETEDINSSHSATIVLPSSALPRAVQPATSPDEHQFTRSISCPSESKAAAALGEGGQSKPRLSISKLHLATGFVSVSVRPFSLFA
jgi:hypothetical protein